MKESTFRMWINTRKFWKLGLIVIAAVILVALLWWPSIVRQFQQPSNERVYRIGYQETALYRHVFVAKQARLFDGEGVKVELVPFRSANDMMKALISGDLDVLGLANLEVALRVEEEDAGKFKFVNFLVWDEKSFPDFILDCTPMRELKGLDSLEGRTMGRHPGTAVKAFASAVLVKAGVDQGQVRQEELEPGLMREAVMAGRVDALYAMDPIASRLVLEDVCSVMLPHPLGTIVEGPIPISGMAVSSKLLAEDPKGARAIISAIDRSIVYQRDAAVRDDVAKAIASFTPIDASLANKLNNSVYWTSQEMRVVEVQRVADRFHTLGISKSAVPVQQMFEQ